MHLPQDDIFTFEVQVRLSDIKDDMANGKIWPIKIAASNGKVWPSLLIALKFSLHVSLLIRDFFSRLFPLDREMCGLWVTLGQEVPAAQLKFKNEDMEHLACPSGHVPVSISTLNIERMMKLHRMWKAGAPAEISADRGRTAGTGPGTKRILASTHSNVSP